MTESASLLPANSTPWEIAQSLTSASRRPLPTDLPRQVWNPDTCPVEFLPYLAWGLGLEIWDDEWSEQKKRDVVARIWNLKRLKTTPQGIKDYVNLVDADVVKFVRPRDRMWLVPAMTPAERKEIMAKMPEIRIYPDAGVFSALPEQTFYGFSFWGASAYLADSAEYYYSKRAVYKDGDLEVDVSVVGINSAIDASYRIQLQASQPWKSFYNYHALQSFRVPSDATDHVVAIAPDRAAQSFAVAPGLIATTVAPEETADTVDASVAKAFHFPSFYNNSFRIPSDAAKHLYSSLRFMNPEKVGTFGRPMSFWGWSRSSIPAFSAELTVQSPIEKPIWSFSNWWGVGFWNAEPLDPLWDSLEAITVAQAARDDIWVSLKLYEPVAFSMGLRFGEFNFGDDRKVV